MEPFDLRVHLVTAFASPEDVIIKKMQYYQEGGSEKHIRDITGMLKLSGNQIDAQYIQRWAQEFGVTAIWDAIVAKTKTQ